MVTIDIRETLIPFSLLEIINAFQNLQPGDEVEILAGGSSLDRATVGDILRILPEADYDVVSRGGSGSADPVTRLRLRKKVSLEDP